MERKLSNGTFKAVKDGVEYLIRVVGIEPFLTVTNCISLNRFKTSGYVRNNPEIKKLIQKSPELFEYHELIFEDAIPGLLFPKNNVREPVMKLKNKAFWDECAARLTIEALQIKMANDLKVSLQDAREIMRYHGYDE